jgi:DNA-binding transcriptional regulator YhcF (GntR family)
MNVKFDTSQPIYLQIMAHIRKQLVRGVIQPGDKISSVRELAIEYGVNQNTMQKALAELERDGYLHSQRTAGRNATTDIALIEKLKTMEFTRAIDVFVKDMAELGVALETLPEMLKEYLNRKEDNK